ncbi:uncharacterized protein DEA37_0006412 [Paragonimus westermani]|uniref:Uncharacterized protein n=1 Tax=Paragonimus westermani TaxID=34504 RepID=A0A5J4N6W3_9TREM|nr:uncharacterized protein DEA37_0006412 [Paragonimus westermani]
MSSVEYTIASVILLRCVISIFLVFPDSCDSIVPNAYALEGIALPTTQFPCSEMEQPGIAAQQILPEIALTELPTNTRSEDLTDVVQVAASTDYTLPTCSNENVPSVSESLKEPSCQPVSQFASSEPADISFEDESHVFKSADTSIAAMPLNSDVIDCNPPLSEPGAPEEESMNAVEPSSDSQADFPHSSAPLFNEIITEEYQEDYDTGDEELETDELEKDVEDEELVEEEEEVMVEQERAEEFTREGDSEEETDEDDLSDENGAADEVAESATGEIIELSSESKAQLKSLGEALTEAKADLVTLKADLATSRSHVSQLSGDLIEAFQVLENMKSNELFRSILQDVTISSTELYNSPVHAGQQLVQILRVALNSLSSELDRLNNQAEEQRERLLRMQLVESQLTKSQRDCAELRSRLSDLQSAVTMATSVHTATTSVTTFTTPELEPTDLSQTSQSYQCRSGAISTAVGAPDYLAVGSVDTQLGDSLTTSAISSLSTQSVPAWILRAAATVQPVQPTPAVTPPNSVTGLKQTAEIRPITSNVATVVPTPALQFVQTTSVAAPIEPILTSSLSLIPITGTNTAESAVSSFVNCQLADQMTHRLDQATGTTVRTIHPRRLNVAGQPQSVIDHPSVMAISSGGFSWASTLPSSTSMVSVTGKRRHEDVGLVGSPSTDETLSVSTTVTSIAAVASPDPPRSLEGTQTTTHASGFASVFSEAKRLRPAISFVPGAHQQAEPSAVVMERSAFGFSNTTLPLAHATASRLIAGQEETTGKPSVDDGF